MSDCSTNTWELPKFRDMDSHVLYAPGLTSWIDDVDAIDVRGERFVRERECENASSEGFMCSSCSFGDFGGFHGYEPNYCPNCGAKVVGR